MLPQSSYYETAVFICKIKIVTLLGCTVQKADTEIALLNQNTCQLSTILSRFICHMNQTETEEKFHTKICSRVNSPEIVLIKLVLKTMSQLKTLNITIKCYLLIISCGHHVKYF